MKITIAISEKEKRACFPVIAQLRPLLTEKLFLEKVAIQSKESYQIAYVQEGDKVVAVVGFRIMHNLAYGKFLYVDDLITDQDNRSKGYGDVLFDFLEEYGNKEKCDQLHLDSGVHRFDAHRFYLLKRMKISAHHFALELKEKKVVE